MGVGRISCKLFNPGCVLKPWKKSKLPDGTLVTILSCLPSDRKPLQLLASLMTGSFDLIQPVLREVGVHACELDFREPYRAFWEDVCAVPLHLEQQPAQRFGDALVLSSR